HRVQRAQHRHLVANPQDAVAAASDMMYLAWEELRVIFLNTKHHITGMETIFRGGLDGVEASPREIFRQAVSRSAAAIIVVHNHPSGDPAPSPEDLAMTRRLERAGEVMGIDVLDHIIIGQSRHMSVHHGIVTELS
ncbi:MAG: DNA repair protein RadC, partial [Firmicutes bacterium]|nr:DNA repair protein RadC [Bacillota bacterium]